MNSLVSIKTSISCDSLLHIASFHGSSSKPRGFDFVVQALSGDPTTIHGDGRQTRPCRLGSDFVEGLIRLMEWQPDVTGPINPGSPAEMPVRELAHLVVGMTGSRSELVSLDLPQDDSVQRPSNITEAGMLLRWEPKVPHDRGLENAIVLPSRLLEERVAVGMESARAGGAPA